MRIWQTRAMLFVAAAGLLMIDYGFAKTAHLEKLWPNVWLWWFGAAAVATLLLAIRMSSNALYLASGVLTPTACLGRLFAVAANAHAGLYADSNRMWLGIGVYLIIGALWTSAWRAAVGPAHVWYQQHRGVCR